MVTQRLKALAVLVGPILWISSLGWGWLWWGWGVVVVVVRGEGGAVCLCVCDRRKVSAGWSGL